MDVVVIYSQLVLGILMYSTNRADLDVVFDGVEFCVVESGHWIKFVAGVQRSNANWLFLKHLSWGQDGRYRRENNCVVIRMNAIFQGASTAISQDRKANAVTFPPVYDDEASNL
jgi:hypothetical protein